MIRINLIPVPKVRKQQKLIIEAIVAVASIIGVVIVCSFVSSLKEQAVSKLKAENQEITNQISQLKSKVGEVEKYKQKLQTLKDQLGVINSLQAGRAGPVRMMDELTSLVPRKLWLTTFREQNKKVSVQGYGDDGPTIADFLDNLKQSQYFSNVELDGVQQAAQDGADVHRFTINMSVKYDR